VNAFTSRRVRPRIARRTVGSQATGGRQRLPPLCVALTLVLGACGSASEPEPVAPATATVDEHCAKLAQEVTDAYSRGDREAEKAAADAFDRDCDR
jgi:hypothetical protein